MSIDILLKKDAENLTYEDWKPYIDSKNNIDDIRLRI
jgi:hypothetical protein